MVRLDMRQAVRELSRAHRELGAKERGRAMSAALNRAVITGRANAAKTSRKKYNVRSGDVKKTIGLVRSTPSSLEARFKSKGRTLPLSSFRPNATKKGITARIGQSRHLFPGAFKLKLKGGHEGIFARAQYKGNKLVSRRTRVKRYPANDLPITEIQSLSVPSALSNKVVNQNLSKIMQKAVVNRYAQELRFRSMKAAGLI